MRLFKLAAFTLASLIVAAPAMAASCYDLWYARNAIYKDNGYCFKTNLGISTFGNDGCWTNYAHLSPGEQSRVNAIQREERYRGCHVN